MEKKCFSKYQSIGGCSEREHAADGFTETQHRQSRSLSSSILDLPRWGSAVWSGSRCRGFTRGAAEVRGMCSTTAMARHDDSGWVFARARPVDSGAMRQLARRAYEIYVDRVGQEPAPMASDFETIAASGRALLVWRERNLVGMIVTRLEENTLLAENIAVSPEVQGSGLGTALLVKADCIAHSAGKEAVRSYTNEAMVYNSAFELNGFRFVVREVPRSVGRMASMSSK